MPPRRDFAGAQKAVNPVNPVNPLLSLHGTLQNPAETGAERDTIGEIARG